MTPATLTPPRTRDAIPDFDGVCAGALEQLGLVAEATETPSARRADFVAWGALALKDSGVWLDLEVTLDRDSANALLDALLGSVPDSDDDLIDAIRETVNILQGSLKAAVVADGAESFTPIIPVVSAASALPPLISTDPVQVYYHTAPGLVMRIAAFTAHAPERLKRPRLLIPGDLLAAPVVQEGSGTLLLSKGVVLTERYINRLIGIAERTDKDFNVSVIEPPPTTRPRLRNIAQ
jgi:hypothetical protein